MLFLAGHFARLAARAVFVINEQTVRRHLNHQLSESIPYFHHVGVVVLVDGRNAAQEALERRTEPELSDVLVRYELVDVRAPHLVQARLFGVFLGEPEAVLRMDDAGLDDLGFLRLEDNLAERVDVYKRQNIQLAAMFTTPC